MSKRVIEAMKDDLLDEVKKHLGASQIKVQDQPTTMDDTSDDRPNAPVPRKPNAEGRNWGSTLRGSTSDRVALAVALSDPSRDDLTREQ